MQVFAIGDIHGCATALDTLLTAIPFQPGDRIVALGDYINKGPDSRRVLDRLIGLQRADQLVALRGNHEIKMLRAIDHQRPIVDGSTLVDFCTLASYGHSGRVGSLADIPKAHQDFIETHCHDWWEIEGFLFVHATVEPQKPLNDQSEQVLRWTKFNYPEPHISGKVIVCGHTPQMGGWPLNIGHAICLDTYAHGGGWLSCLEVNSGWLWQANQRRELRKSRIQDCLEGSV
ncbi:serine/threonine protein phosphatase [filamentous cyanobacterium CCP5]|nr:serine/threonine protein phosphatase [filamentous cyanobacterium CCP5]